jgi:protein-tyrosine phosphatase
MQDGADAKSPLVSDVRSVLFICTGNYYRSRFAESLFNATAQRSGLPWRATSRGTDVLGAGRFNVGPLSIAARQGLEARGVPVDDNPRYPAQLTASDLNGADLAIAVCEAEHRPHLKRDFGAAAERVEYWAVQDLAFTPADDALSALERLVTALIERLRAAAS